MQHCSPSSSWFIAIPLTVGVVVTSLSGAQPVRSSSPDARARKIVDRALERAAWTEERGLETRYRRTMTRWVRLFDDRGNVTEDETRLYEVEPYRGELFHKLTARNGQPLKPLDRIEQEKRWEVFRSEADDPRRERRDDQDDNEIEFNEELVARYTVVLEGIRELRGRPTYVLSFGPRPGELPVRRRIDRALNRSQGEIWIDRETHEIARVNFEMMESVRLWWGVLGTISDAAGRLERGPVVGDVWLNTELDIYFHARVLLRTTRRNQILTWSRFALTE